jgi:Ca2+-binding EF-hand superfamily protein
MVCRLWLQTPLLPAAFVLLQEFLTATVFLGKLQRRENLITAFQHFDNDSSGYITEEELLMVSCSSQRPSCW